MWQNEYYYQSERPAAPAPGRSGSGGAHSNITVVGARYGVDARDTQPSASLTNVRLLNQSCAALLHEGPRPGCTPWCAWHGAHGAHGHDHEHAHGTMRTIRLRRG